MQNIHTYDIDFFVQEAKSHMHMGITNSIFYKNHKVFKTPDGFIYISYLLLHFLFFYVNT